MKVAIIGARGADTMEENLQDAFTYGGHECEIFDIYDQSHWFSNARIGKVARTIDKIKRQYSEGYDKKVFKRLANKVNDYNPELVVCLYRFIHPIFVEEVKKVGRKVIHVNPDQMTTLEYQQVFASDYDVWFTKDPYMLNFMKEKMKLNTYLYSEAFNQRFHVKPTIPKQVAEQDVGIDVMTYGTFYPYRTRMLKHVLDAGINMKIYGVIPRRFYNEELETANQHKFISGEEKSRLLYGSKIVFNQMHFAEVGGVNCRFFEVYGSGAFQLSDYRPILHDLLPINPELVSFKSIDEGIEKIKYYLNHEEERYEIAQKVYEHFMRHYTYDHLVAYILDTI